MAVYSPEWWHSSADVFEMLKLLAGRALNRKLRLFACHCCRFVWDELEDRHRKAVEAREGWVEGLLSDRDLSRAADAFQFRGGPRDLMAISVLSTESGAWGDAHSVVSWVQLMVGGSRRADLAVRTTDLLRDLIHYPLVPIAGLDWLRRQPESTVQFARGIYADRRFDALPVLGDMLEDAGCPDPELLDHLRSAVDHRRGCWALDAALGID